MKKSMFGLIILFIACTQAMEEVNPNSWSITLHGTKINLNKGFIGDADDRVDVIVLGRKQQETLIEPWRHIKGVRYEWLPKNAPFPTIMKKHQDDESDSDDDTYKIFDPNALQEKELWKRASEINSKCETVRIPEPTIVQRNNDVFEDLLVSLETCYKDILTAIIEELDDIKQRKIAIPALSTEVGFPREKAAPIAIKAIVEFIQNNPNAYAVIELFVKKRSEFKLYQELLEQSAAEK